MPPHPHAHGGDDEEEEASHGPRVDGPPFMDLVSKQGRGFDVDYSLVQKVLGPGTISLSDFLRDVEIINRVYVPVSQRSFRYMRIGTGR